MTTFWTPETAHRLQRELSASNWPLSATSDTAIDLRIAATILAREPATLAKLAEDAPGLIQQFGASAAMLRMLAAALDAAAASVAAATGQATATQH